MLRTDCKKKKPEEKQRQRGERLRSKHLGGEIYDNHITAKLRPLSSHDEYGTILEYSKRPCSVQWSTT